jgi:hypothetical protein
MGLLGAHQRQQQQRLVECCKELGIDPRNVTHAEVVKAYRSLMLVLYGGINDPFNIRS